MYILLRLQIIKNIDHYLCNFILSLSHKKVWSEYYIFLEITNNKDVKNIIIDQDKIKAELEAYKKKPKKKKAGFAQRLEIAMKEQQRIQEEREKNKKKKK